MTGRRILQISLLRITVFEISCRIWCTKVNDFRSQTYWPSKRLSQTNGERSPSRQFKNPLHPGKDHWMQLKSRMMARFSTISPVSVTAERFHVFWCVGLNTVWIQKVPPLQFSDIFPKRLGIFNQFLHTYYTLLSTLDYKFFFNYLQLWRSYAILSETPIDFFLYFTRT